MTTVRTPRDGRWLALFPRRFVKFAAVGFTGVAVDMVVLFLLSDAHTLGWGLTPSKIIASELAIANNFFWNDTWTFGDLAARQGYAWLGSGGSASSTRSAGRASRSASSCSTFKSGGSG